MFCQVGRLLLSIQNTVSTCDFFFLKAKAIYMEYCSVMLHANLYLKFYSYVFYKIFIKYILHIFVISTRKIGLPIEKNIKTFIFLQV